LRRIENNDAFFLFVERINRPFSVAATSLGAAEMVGLYTGLWKEDDFDAAFTFISQL
jgi:hypothetical protein